VLAYDLDLSETHGAPLTEYSDLGRHILCIDNCAEELTVLFCRFFDLVQFAIAYVQRQLASLWENAEHCLGDDNQRGQLLLDWINERISHSAWIGKRVKNFSIDLMVGQKEEDKNTVQF
jgi:hypothetical protein